MTLRSSVEHQPGVRPRLGQRVGPHAQQQGLVGLAGAVDAEVRQRGRRQDPAQGVEGLGPDGLPVHEVGVARVLRVDLAEEVDEDGHQLGVGVEEPVHVAHVAGAERAGEDLGRAEEPIAAADAGVIGDVAGRLLEVGGEPPPLEHLRQEVRRLLAREVHAAELGDGVVAVLEEDAVVELLGPAQADGRVDGRVAGDVEIADELVEEQPPEALRAAGCSGRTARP